MSKKYVTDMTAHPPMIRTKAAYLNILLINFITSPLYYHLIIVISPGSFNLESLHQFFDFLADLSFDLIIIDVGSDAIYPVGDPAEFRFLEASGRHGRSADPDP